MSAEVKGLDKVVANLRKEINGIKNRSKAGLLAAGLIVQAEAQKRTPREYGNLAASADTQPVGNGLTVKIIFSAEYALYVHENMERKLAGQPRPSGLGVYWNPGEPRYLANALTFKQPDVVKTIADYAKVA